MNFSTAASTIGANQGGGNGTPKGRKQRKDIKPTTKGQNSGWFLKAEMLSGLLELITLTTSSGMEDGFINPLIVALENPNSSQNDVPEILNQGLLGAFYMRISLTNTGRLMNIRKGVIGQYQRKAFIRVVDEGEDTPMHRLASLNVMKAFFEDANNNKFGTKVNILEPGWDLTSTPLRKLDHYLEYREIVKILKELFVNVDGNWAAQNMEAAMCFFTEGHIPLLAHTELGFPLEDCMVMTQTTIANGKEEDSKIGLPVIDYDVNAEADSTVNTTDLAVDADSTVNTTDLPAEKRRLKRFRGA
ncbi:MAG: hypothetical protein ACRCZI_00940 [Cetobacterium sp.]